MFYHMLNNLVDLSNTDVDIFLLTYRILFRLISGLICFSMAFTRKKHILGINFPTKKEVRKLTYRCPHKDVTIRHKDRTNRHATYITWLWGDIPEYLFRGDTKFLACYAPPPRCRRPRVT